MQVNIFIENIVFGDDKISVEFLLLKDELNNRTLHAVNLTVRHLSGHCFRALESKD